MMVTGSRNVIRILGTTGNDLPKTFLSTVKGSRKGRRCKKQAERFELPSKVERHQPNFLLSNYLNNEDEGTQLSTDHTCLPLGCVATVCRAEKTPLSFHGLVQSNVYTLLMQETVIHTNSRLLLTVNPDSEEKIDSLLRRTTLFNLRCLHRAYYGLPTLVFCKAVHLMDLLIAKVKVKPKYAVCVAAACYYIASKFDRNPPQSSILPTPESLVMLSRCGGTADDLKHMVEIILSKLTTDTITAVGACPSTAYDFLRTFTVFASSQSVGCNTSAGRNVMSSMQVPTSFLCRQLELVLTSTEVSSYRPSCLALALLSRFCLSLDQMMVINPDLPMNHVPELDENLRFTLSDLFNLALLCGVRWTDVSACMAEIDKALAAPEVQVSSRLQEFPTSRLLSSSPPLVWTLSRRTQRSISTSCPPCLPTLSEEDEAVTGTSSAHVDQLTDSLEKLRFVDLLCPRLKPDRSQHCSTQVL